MTLLLEFDGDYGSYLRMDYSINCDSAEHKFYQAYALLLCCFVAVQFSPIGVPLMYYFLLHRLKNLIDLGQKRLSFELGEEAGFKLRSWRGSGKRRRTKTYKGFCSCTGTSSQYFGGSRSSTR